MGHAVTTTQMKELTMKRTITALAVTALAATGASEAAAKSTTYKGKTKYGNTITFKRAGSKISQIKTLVPTTCVPATSRGGGPPSSGSEMFTPPGSFRVGPERRVAALQDAAMHYDKVTKNYRVTLKRGARGRLTGRLHVNFSKETLGYSSFSGTYLIPWICQGDDAFTVAPPLTPPARTKETDR